MCDVGWIAVLIVERRASTSSRKLVKLRLAFFEFLAPRISGIHADINSKKWFEVELF